MTIVTDFGKSSVTTIPPIKYQFLQGDLNFVERLEDSSSMSDYYKLPLDFADEWAEFCYKHNFREVKAESHTRFSISKDPAKSTSAKLSRFYHTFSDAELELISPTVIRDFFDWAPYFLVALPGKHNPFVLSMSHLGHYLTQDSHKHVKYRKEITYLHSKMLSKHPLFWPLMP